MNKSKTKYYSETVSRTVTWCLMLKKQILLEHVEHVCKDPMLHVDVCINNHCRYARMCIHEEKFI